MNPYYLVSYCGGEAESAYTTAIFVTDNKATATEYCDRFNKILAKWKARFAPHKIIRPDLGWHEYDVWASSTAKHYRRYRSLEKIDSCYCEEVEFR